MKTEAQKAGETKVIRSLYWLRGHVGAAFPGIYSPSLCATLWNLCSSFEPLSRLWLRESHFVCWVWVFLYGRRRNQRGVSLGPFQVPRPVK